MLIKLFYLPIFKIVISVYLINKKQKYFALNYLKLIKNMDKLSLLLLIFFALNINAQTNPNYHWVDSYTTQNGVYVPGHYQTNSNNTKNDNWSTEGNVNPITGKEGWKERDIVKKQDDYNFDAQMKAQYRALGLEKSQMEADFKRKTQESIIRDENKLLRDVQNQLKETDAFLKSITIYYTTTQVVNIRSGPGTNYKIIGKLPANFTFTTMDDTDQWIYCWIEGKQGYVYKGTLIKGN